MRLAALFLAPLCTRALLCGRRVTVNLLPDSKLGDRVEGAEKGRIAALREAMAGADVDGVVANTHALKEMQEKPDAPEALACVPALSLSDIPKSITKVPTDVSSVQGATLLTHDLFTNDVLYMEVRAAGVLQRCRAAPCPDPASPTAHACVHACAVHGAHANA